MEREGKGKQWEKEKWADYLNFWDFGLGKWGNAVVFGVTGGCVWGVCDLVIDPVLSEVFCMRL